MKKTLFLTALFSSLMTFSSDYVPFPTDSAYWVVNEMHTGQNSAQYSEGQLFFISGDTLISGTNYTKVTHAYLGIQNDYFGWSKTGPEVRASFNYSFCFRNDTINKKVLKIEKGSIIEKEWYNFNLQIGDTLPQSILNHESEFVVIDSISTVNICGKERKKYWFDPCYPFTNFIIEGAGFSSNFLQYHGECRWFEPGTTYQTFFKSDSCYDDNFISTITSAAAIDLSSFPITISPNPTVNDITIENLASGNTIQILDMQGSVVKQQNSNIKTISLAELPNAIYLVRISTKGGEIIHSQLIIKQ